MDNITPEATFFGVVRSITWIFLLIYLSKTNPKPDGSLVMLIGKTLLWGGVIVHSAIVLYIVWSLVL